jgi:hypothetical protein
MSSTAEIIEQFAPLFVILFALVPVLTIFAFNKTGEKPKPANYHWLIVYLIVLALIACLIIVLKGIDLMPVDNSDRSLFICSILAIACIDQALNLMPVRVRLQFDLVGLLLYSIILLCSMPLLWQILRQTLSAELSNKPEIMRAAEITLMLLMVIICVINGLIKRVKRKENHQ